jgi:hypothetical protein
MDIWVFRYDIVGGRGYRKEDGQESEASNENAAIRPRRVLLNTVPQEQNCSRRAVGGQRNRIIGSPLAAESAACERHLYPRSQARPVPIDRIGLNGHPT